jgi:hypothetical protein
LVEGGRADERRKMRLRRKGRREAEGMLTKGIDYDEKNNIKECEGYIEGV